jgi:ribosomal protein S18 acetylase RimI-like enzyme
MGAESVEIRLLTAADAEAWSKLRLEALERDAEAFSSSVEEHRRLRVEDVRQRLALEPEGRFVVGAFVSEELVGVAGFYRDTGPKTRHKGHVWGVYATAAMREKGIGRRLMEALLERAAKIAGLEQIQLAVTATQAAAMRMYRGLGFEVFAREVKALKIGERYIDEDFLVLWLRSPQ